MKNIQIIDSADNCTYSIFAATEEEFDLIFADGTDIEFAEDFVDRVGETMAIKITLPIWKRPIEKKDVNGIHGTLFYGLLDKKCYYSTKRESEMISLGVDQ